MRLKLFSEKNSQTKQPRLNFQFQFIFGILSGFQIQSENVTKVNSIDRRPETKWKLRNWKLPWDLLLSSQKSSRDQAYAKGEENGQPVERTQKVWSERPARKRNWSNSISIKLFAITELSFLSFFFPQWEDEDAVETR